MKNSNIPANKAKTQPHHDDRRADIRDDLDSRKNEENDTKGDDTTHNRKEKRSERKKDGRN
jgi:hypothetical protein